MKLSEWNAMSQKEQEDYFSKHMGKVEVELGSFPLPEKSEAIQELEKLGATLLPKCSEAIKELRKKVKEQINDELRGANDYFSTSEEIKKRTGETREARIYEYLGDNELLHSIILENILDKIDESCGQ